jgi:hypothetical protein
LGNIDIRGSHENATRLFVEVIQSVEIPPSSVPLLQVDAVSRSVDLEEVLGGGESRQSYAFEWDDGPVAFRVRGIASPLIALAVSYHAGPDSICENTAQVLICRIYDKFARANLDSVVSDSEGLSFAQLREAYIMAGQLAFEGNREICMKDLSSGILSLRETSQLSTRRISQAGFIGSS